MFLPNVLFPSRDIIFFFCPEWVGSAVKLCTRLPEFLSSSLSSDTGRGKDFYTFSQFSRTGTGIIPRPFRRTMLGAGMAQSV
jgi:hypothetical protein